jgi:glycosyltransferase involved in cell wall biosynthesis
MIDIIIPCKNSHKTLTKLLCSISSQIGVEQCKITIVNRIGDPDYSEEIKRFSNIINIQELQYSNDIKGVGGARQFGLDHTSEPYVMFCDSDDLLYDNLVLQNLYKPFSENENLHAVYGQIVQIEKGELKDIPLEHFLWLHGIMYSRKFLEKNNIRFFDNSAGEDAGFNKQVKMLSDRSTVKFLNIPVYFWTDWNGPNRINTKEFAFFSSKKGLIDNLVFAIKNVMKVSDSPYIKGEVIAELCNLFLQTQLSIKEDPSREEPLINWARPYYNEIYKLFEADITEEEFEYIYFENLKAFFEQRTFFIFSFDIHTFLDKLRNLH